MKNVSGTKFSKIVMSIILASYTIMALLTIGVLYNLYYPYKPICLELKVENHNPVRGETLEFKLEGEKFMPIPVDAFIELVDGENYAIMSYFENNPVGKFVKTKKFIVPNIKPGEYKLRWTGKYKVNCMREVNVTAYSNGFYLK